MNMQVIFYKTFVEQQVNMQLIMDSKQMVEEILQEP